jgi:hypothetical protein
MPAGANVETVATPNFPVPGFAIEPVTVSTLPVAANNVAFSVAVSNVSHSASENPAPKAIAKDFALTALIEEIRPRFGNRSWRFEKLSDLKKPFAVEETRATNLLLSIGGMLENCNRQFDTPTAPFEDSAEDVGQIAAVDMLFETVESDAWNSGYVSIKKARHRMKAMQRA